MSPASSPRSVSLHRRVFAWGARTESLSRRLVSACQWCDNRHTLGKGSGLIPVIFRKAQSKVLDPAKLRRLVELIDSETWVGLDIMTGRCSRSTVALLWS